MSERRSSSLLTLHRTTCRYERRRPDDAELIEALRVAAARYPRYGYRRLHRKLVKSGVVGNHKRTYRVYCET